MPRLTYDGPIPAKLRRIADEIERFNQISEAAELRRIAKVLDVDCGSLKEAHHE